MIQSIRLSGLPTILLAGFLGFTTSVMAQTTTEAPATDSPTVPGDLALGDDGSGEPQVGEAYTKEVNGAWQMRCVRTDEADVDPCQMYQLLNDPQGSPVAEVSLFRLPEGGRAEAGATIIVPLETALQQRLTIQVDGNPPKQYPFSFCNRIGCYARIGLTPEDVVAYKRGAVAKLSIVPALAPDQKVELEMGLTGFTKSYSTVSVVQQQ